jgi:penicillin-binding protein 2
MKASRDNREFVLIFLAVLIGLVLIIQLLRIQIIDEKYKLSSENNSQRVSVSYPSRGLITDRNGKIIVANEACYDLIAIPSLIKKFDTSKLCVILDIDKDELIKNLRKAKRYSKRLPSIVVKNISAQNNSKFQELLFLYPGFTTEPRTRRVYYEDITGHVLGYVGEVDKKIIKKHKEYSTGDHIGYSGVEKQYEKYLRGKKGKQILVVDVHNVVKGSFSDGQFDTPSEKGRDIKLTIDVELQKYVEKLMQNKRGSVIALDPKSGEILSLLSSPDYKSSSLVGRNRSESFKQISQNKYNVLFNRALMAKYPPGSTFKPVNALICLQENAVTQNTMLPCRYGYHSGSFRLGCHHNRNFSTIDAIAESCNAYFCYAMQNMVNKNKEYHKNYQVWYNHLKKFGLGTKLGVDFTNELSGYIPDTGYFDRMYGKNGWKASSIISLSIGQGELSFTPMQMANMTAIIANRGFYYIPHIVKSIEGEKSIDSKYTEKIQTDIDSVHFEPVIAGMAKVMTHGTATYSKIQDIEICGKTGTAENPHGEDHSIFIAFAPRNNPKIAVAVYIENGGFGSTWAAPMTSLIIEKYINKKIKHQYKEDRIVNADLMNLVKKENSHH